MTDERDKSTLIFGSDFEELPGVREVRGRDGIVMLSVDHEFVDAYRAYFDPEDGAGRLRLTLGALVRVVPARPPLGQVRYMPTHNHGEGMECGDGCPVLSWQRHVERHGSPYDRRA